MKTRAGEVKNSLNMEKLTENQKESVKKMSTARLISKLLSVGYTEEALETLNRPELLETWAQCMSEGKHLLSPKSAVGYDPEIEKQRLEFEIRRYEEEKDEKAEDAARKKEELLLEKQIALQSKRLEINE